MSARHPLAPAYAVALPERNAVLLFGLHWAPLVGSRPALLARRRAIAAHATHYIHLGRLGVCFGMARLNRRWRRASHRHHAAAAMFAACQEGSPVVWLTRLPDGRYWLVAVRDGAVLSRSDRLYPDLEQGQRAMRGLCSEFPGLHEVSDEQAFASLSANTPIAGQAGSDVGPSSPTSVTNGACAGVPQVLPLIDALTARVQPGDAMIALGWYGRARSAWWACSLPMIAGIVWRTLLVAPPGPEPGSERVHVATPQDAQSRWRSAHAAAMSAKWQGAESFVSVLTRVRGVPVSLVGWQLSVVQCDWVKPAWHCRADFDRVDPRATNSDFLDALPSAWTARFAPLGQASAQWTVPAPSWDERANGLPDADWVDSILVSTLQHRAQAFTHITVGAADVLVVDDVPRSETGEPIAAPSGMPRPRRRAIQLQGPLRSFGLLLAVDPHVAWNTLRLTFAPRAEVSLSRSALHLELGGWVHEQISA